MKDEDFFIELIQDELGDRPATTENVMEASITIHRRRIYEKYYWAKPDVVEALLLHYRNFMEMMLEEIDKIPDGEWIDAWDEKSIVRAVALCSLSIAKTLDQLYKV